MDLLPKRRKTHLQILSKNEKDEPRETQKRDEKTNNAAYLRLVQQQQNIAVYSHRNPKTETPHYYNYQMDGPCFHLKRYTEVGM